MLILEKLNFSLFLKCFFQSVHLIPKRQIRICIYRKHENSDDIFFKIIERGFDFYNGQQHGLSVFKKPSHNK